MNNVKYMTNYKTNILDQQKWSKSNTNNSLKIIILFFAYTNLNFICIYQILSFFRFTSQVLNGTKVTLKFMKLAIFWGFTCFFTFL